MTVFIIVFGVYILTKMRRDVFPNVDFNHTIVSTVLPGASPKQMETLVINVIEPRLREVDGLRLIRSTAIESVATITIQLDPDAKDPDKTNSDIQKAIDQLEDLPEDAEKPIITTVESGKRPVIEVNISGDEATPLELREATKHLYDELSKIRDVSSIYKMGYLKKEWAVVANPEKLAQRNISLNTLIQKIRRNNISFPGGTVKSGGGTEALVRTESQFQSSQELLDSVLLINDAGFETRISDVAKVYETFEEPRRLYRADGKESLVLRVAKKTNGDALDLVKQVKGKITEVQKDLKDTIQLSFSNDASVYLANRLRTLTWSLTIGLVLVVLVLIFFLPWQLTLVVSVGIPMALFATLMMASLLGFSLNVVSLLGLIIVLGMLVDDAIVVCENIWRHVEKGKNKTQAVIDGTCEVFSPIVASILTTISAFAPMLFMSGVFGAFVFHIPVMVILALIFSLLEVFLIMPSHFTSWVNPFINHSKLVAKAQRKTWFDRVNQVYQGYIHWSLKFRYLVILFTIILAALTIQTLKTKGRFVLFPNDGADIFFVNIEAPTDVSLETMAETIVPIEKAVARIPAHELKDFSSTVGAIEQDSFDPQKKRGSNYASIRVTLAPSNTRKRTAQEIIDELRSLIEPPPPGVTQVKVNLARMGPPQGRAVSIDLVGTELDKLQVISQRVKSELAKIVGVKDISDSFIEGKKEWQVLPRFKDMALVGVSSSEVALSVQAAFAGVVASSIRDLDEETNIRVRLNERRMKEKKGKENRVKGKKINHPFTSIHVGNSRGQLTPLTEIVDVKKVRSLSTIQHVNHQRVINVSADVDVKQTTATLANRQIQPIVEKILKEYPSHSVRYGGEDEDTRESLGSLYTAFTFAAFIIFALLVITFKNILQPIVILTSIPMGFMGAYYALLLHGRPFSFMALLGVVALAGVIVNNAIVFTDFVNQQRKKGVGINDSIVQAAGMRFRPILLTTVTTVCGLLPTAYGETIQDIFGVGGGDPFVVPIALALGWGLAFGSVMTSLFFPVFLRVLDDFKWCGDQVYRLFKWILGGGEQPL